MAGSVEATWAMLRRGERCDGGCKWVVRGHTVTHVSMRFTGSLSDMLVDDRAEDM